MSDFARNMRFLFPTEIFRSIPMISNAFELIIMSTCARALQLAEMDFTDDAPNEYAYIDLVKI